MNWFPLLAATSIKYGSFIPQVREDDICQCSPGAKCTRTRSSAEEIEGDGSYHLAAKPNSVALLQHRAVGLHSLSAPAPG